MDDNTDRSSELCDLVKLDIKVTLPNKHLNLLLPENKVTLSEQILKFEITITTIHTTPFGDLYFKCQP